MADDLGLGGLERLIGRLIAAKAAYANAPVVGSWGAHRAYMDAADAYDEAIGPATVLALITRLRASEAATAKAVGWQDISAAPKGPDILAYVPGLGMGQMVLFWMDGYWREKANMLGLKTPPTHWQPLPAPPALPSTPPVAEEKL